MAFRPHRGPSADAGECSGRRDEVQSSPRRAAHTQGPWTRRLQSALATQPPPLAGPRRPPTYQVVSPHTPPRPGRDKRPRTNSVCTARTGGQRPPHCASAAGSAPLCSKGWGGHQPPFWLGHLSLVVQAWYHTCHWSRAQVHMCVSIQTHAHTSHRRDTCYMHTRHTYHACACTCTHTTYTYTYHKRHACMHTHHMHACMPRAYIPRMCMHAACTYMPHKHTPHTHHTHSTHPTHPTRTTHTHLNLLDIYKTFHPTTTGYTFFSSVH